MGSTQEAPPPSSARLFVGNLVPSITDVALLRLFSRFGDTSDLQRNSEEAFAHLSIKFKDDNASDDIERVVKSLNRTTWCGTTLRVERAQEHFLERLKREWAEERNNDRTDVDIETQQSSADHFANYKKGKHTKFSFPDVEFQELDLGNEKDDDFEATGVENSSEHVAVLSEPELVAETVKAPNGSNPVKSARMDSTLALFGLCSSASERPLPTLEGADNNKRDHPTRELIPAKRPRHSKKCNDGQTNEATEDPSVVDIDAEKDKERMILQKLFPESQAISDVASCRRQGLYRNLSPCSKDGPNREEGSGARDNRPMLASGPSSRKTPEQGGVATDRFRRAGLYKKLMISTP